MWVRGSEVGKSSTQSVVCPAPLTLMRTNSIKLNSLCATTLPLAVETMHFQKILRSRRGNVSGPVNIIYIFVYKVHPDI